MKRLHIGPCGFTKVQYLIMAVVLCLCSTFSERTYAQTSLKQDYEYRFFPSSLFKDPTQAPVVTAIAIPEDRCTDFFVGTDDRCVYKFSFDSQEVERVFVPSDSWVRAVAYSPTANEVATLSQNGQLVIWNPQTQQKMRESNERVRGSHAFAYSPNGKVIAVSSFDPIVMIFNAENLVKLRAWEAPGTSSTSIQFSHYGDLLALGGRNGVVRIWDTKTGTIAKEISFTQSNGNNKRRVRTIAFSNDDSLVAIAGDSNQIDVWNLKTGQKLTTLTLPAYKLNSTSVVGQGKVYSLTFCGEKNNLLVSGDTLNRVILWDVSSGNVLSEGVAHTGTVSSLQYVEHSEGPFILSGSFDASIIRWKLQ